MSSDRIVRPAPISGFPEWLPEVRLAEQNWIDRIRATYERYGFCSVETPSVEALDVLLAKGETSKEIYTLSRLQAEPGESSDARLALHFDLTVPLARYVAQHFNDLVFPFKRYAMQRSWRGERPQEGRFREFTQCDIDVINVDAVPLHFDAEIPRIVAEALLDLDVGPFAIGINNRKVLQGFYTGLGIAEVAEVLRIVDKLDKIGADAVGKLLGAELGLTDTQISACLELAQVRGGASVVDRVAGLGSSGELLETGLEELSFVMNELADLPEGLVVADLSIARGLDYYTGTVYEGRFLDAPGFGSICGGGRYDNLAGEYIRKHLPGVGMTLGLSRIFAKFVAEGRFDGGPKSPADVLVVIPSGERRALAMATARQLRSRGLKVEAYHDAAKVGKQIAYASKKLIPNVWFPPFDDSKPHEVKDMRTGEQTPADPTTWLPA
ncbi:MAG: histidine--tRNA ligase [Sporichthyaceae bacterium]